MALTFGRVPHPGYIDISGEMAGKREGNGWNNLGQRQPKFVALHRMWGTLAGTRSYFSNPGVGALTDYGLGVASVDGAANSGVIHLYNNPRGFRSPWASGPVSAPYGDGLAFVNKFGINAVNRDGVSVEVSGYENDPLNDLDRRELVALIAYWADQCKVPYTSLPLNPNTGVNFIIWHHEFTAGTGKQCPFTYVKGITNRLYDEVITVLKPYQEGDATSGETQQPPAEQPVPTPQYARPVPIKELAMFGADDADTARALVLVNGTDFVWVNDRVRAIKQTPRLQYATADAKRTGPDITAGEEFDVLWLCKAGDGAYYYITPWWTRVRAADCERIGD